MRRIAFVVLLVLPISGCVFNHGRRASQLMGGDGVHGATGVVVARPSPESSKTREYRGELLEVQDSGLLILSGQGIGYIPFRAIRQARFGHVKTGEGAPNRPALRNVARYSQGLTPAQRRRLLEAYGQEAPRPLRVERDPPAVPDTLDVFLATAREAATRYHRLEGAIAAGYRRLGPAFPGMGEHWIHPGLIVAGHVDPRRAPVLCYARLNGEPTLVALAFTVPLEPDEEPPEYPAGRHIWHDHADSVDEEVLLLAHPASHGVADGPRLAMFHAWLWLDNPDGPLAQNNWRLPFLQAAVDLGEQRVSADAARALSLWTADPGYYATLFEAAAQLESTERQALRELLDSHRDRARRWVLQSRAEGARTPVELAALEEIWGSLWMSIQRALGPATWERVRVLH